MLALVRGLAKGGQQGALARRAGHALIASVGVASGLLMSAEVRIAEHEPFGLHLACW